MPKPPAPSDPAATFVDDVDTGEQRVRTEPQALPWTEDTGPSPVLVPSEETTGPSPALIPSEEHTGPSPALILSGETTGPTTALNSPEQPTRVNPVPERRPRPEQTPEVRRSKSDHRAIEARRSRVDHPVEGRRPKPDDPVTEVRRSSTDHPLVEERRSTPGDPATEGRRSRTYHPVVEGRHSTPADPVTDLRRSRINHPVANPRHPSKTAHPVAAPVELSLVDVSEESTNPLRRQLEAADLAARATVTKEDPDPASAWRAWLASPASRGWRIGGGITLGLFAAMLLAILFTPPARPNPPPPPRRILRPEPAEAPKGSRPLAVVPVVVPQAPLFIDVEVDAGDGAIRIEQREAGVMKLISFPPTEVIVGGRRLGVTPVHLSAPVGRVEVLLESRDAGIYKPVVVTLYPGQNPPRSWDLGRGWLEVIAPDGSQVSVDGRGVGTAPVPQLSLFEGFHRVEVVRPDKTRASARVEVVPSFTVTHEVGDR